MSRLSLYDPFAEVFPELFRGFMQPTVKGEAGVNVDIRVDVKESPKDYTVTAEIPGVKKEDIKVEIEGAMVSIAAEVKRESEKKDGEKLIRSERYYGAVSRAFTLGNDIDDKAASAKYENGVLTLVLPKREGGANGRRLAIA